MKEAHMSFMQSLGFGHKEAPPAPPVKVELPQEVKDAVTRAILAHRETRLAIRQGNGRVINLLTEALGGGQAKN